MDFLGYVFVFLIIACILIVIIGKLTYKKPPKQSDIAINAIRGLKKLFESNNALYFNETFSKLDVPDTIKNMESLDAIKHHFELKEDTMESDLFNSYLLSLARRKDYLYKKLSHIADVEINLNSNEFVYCKCYPSLYEIKIISRNIIYSGVRLSKGVLRGGSLSCTSNDIKDFNFTDSGSLYLTNKRIIFIGDQNFISKSVDLNKILTLYVYNDGLLIITESKPILFKFNPVMYLNEDNTQTDELDPIFSDGCFELRTKLSRILDDTYNEDLV